MRYLGAVAVWLLLWAIGTLGIVAGMVAFPFSTTYARRIFVLHDRAAAATLGRSGENTVSHECGQSDWKDCYFCRWVDPLVSWLLRQGDHFKEYKGE